MNEGKIEQALPSTERKFRLFRYLVDQGLGMAEPLGILHYFFESRAAGYQSWIEGNPQATVLGFMITEPIHLRVAVIKGTRNSSRRVFRL